jgi:diguanylate cyclase (GGDEF)-like protein
MQISKPVAQKSSLTMLGVMSWVSVCLLIAGMSSDMNSPQSSLWIFSGLLGLVSAVGLAHVARSEVIAQKKLYDAYISEARTDALTELSNRRAFEDEIRHQISMAQHEGSDMSLMLVDVDRFKSMNDGYGHQAGDFMLRAVSVLLQDAIRTNDFAARFGGEEFAIILPNTCADEAVFMAEKIRNLIGDYEAQFRDHTLNVTVSIGIAQLCDDDDVQSLIEHADNSLYAAKNEGRNCSRLHGKPACHVIQQPTLQLQSTAADASPKTA